MNGWKNVVSMHNEILSIIKGWNNSIYNNIDGYAAA